MRADWDVLGGGDSCESDPDDECALGRREEVLGYEDWADYWSEELVVLWHMLRDQCDANGYAILDACSFPDFSQWAYTRSSGRPPAA